MKRISAAIASFLFVLGMATPAQAADDSCAATPVGSVCLSVHGTQATVTGPGISLSENVPVPPPVKIPVPGPIQKVPGPVVTVPGPTKYIPGPTKIITKTVPGPTRTVEVPGPTKTVTKMVPCPVTPAKPPVQASKVSQKTKVVKTPGHNHYIKVTIPEAVAFSLLALVLGPVLVLLVLYLMYRIGRKEGEHSVDEFLLELRSLTRRK